MQVSFQGRDFRFISTEEKFFNELLPESTPQRGGGGAIDLVRHIIGCNLVQAVKLTSKLMTQSDKAEMSPDNRFCLLMHASADFMLAEIMALPDVSA